MKLCRLGKAVRLGPRTHGRFRRLTSQDVASPSGRDTEPTRTRWTHVFRVL